MNGQMDGQTDGLMDGWANRQFEQIVQDTM